MRNSGIPDDTDVHNIGLTASLGVPPLPGIYSIEATGVPGLHAAYYGSPTPVSDDAIKSELLSTIPRLVQAAGYAPVNGTPEIVAFNNHSPFEVTVSTDAIQKGFYDKLQELQGKKNTWYTGAAWEAQDSSLIWVSNGISGVFVRLLKRAQNWTEYTLIPKLLKKH